MTYQYQQFPNEPIIVSTLLPSYRVEIDALSYSSDGKALLDKVSQPVFFIEDFTRSTLDMQDLAYGASVVAKDPTSLLRHPNIRQILYVTDSEIMRLSASGMNNEVFGNLKIQVFDTLQEALAYARSQN
ncbi:MAG TPA: hypothetical protein PKD09_21000 [Aggregatilinea sp.]|jgi:hypothetical protein|uniref:hypothetical protein n=1 Tax=Aggregatilinea sp. TaxID=2806333 RepID=UPI002CEF8505|nr:hypothetical protein [Aggregatilinea sp.]HML24145.1 hypothetical protein [Aggregatilinea sp.]